MLRVHDLDVAFHPGEALEKKVLNGFDLEAEDGEFICFLGSNGSGKSTLFNALLGKIPYTGEVVLDEKSIDKEKPHVRCRKIGIVFQDPLKGSAPNLTVMENLILAMPKGRKRKEYLETCKKELSAYGLGLEDNFKTEVKSLSGGMRQALTLYMASLGEPRVLLLDEHIAALDPNAANRVMAITNELVKRHPKMIALMVIHNVRLALEYGERLILLKEGKIALDRKGEAKKKLSEEELLKSYQDQSALETVLGST